MRIPLMLSATLLVAPLLPRPLPLAAQDVWSPAFVEVRPFAGIFRPAGAQRADFKSATMVGAQAAMEVNRHFHAVGTVGFTHGHTKLLAQDLTYIWQYDLGVELNAVRQIGRDWDLRPFAGAGAGGRTYDYRTLAAGTRSCVSGYGTVGAELRRDIVAFRAEARDYLSCFEPPLTGTKRTRNDLGLTVGLAYHLR